MVKTKTENLLPKMIAGSVHAQYVKCGKSDCRCAGGELHGAYFYHFVRVSGKLRKRYIKASSIEQMQNACSARQMLEKSRREDDRDSWKQLRELRAKIRSNQPLKQG